MKPPLSDRIVALEASATEELENTVKQMQRDGVRDIISLGVGEPPFDTPENIKQAAWKALQNGKTKYGATQGDFTLREEICAKLKRENGIHADVEDVIVTPGGKFGIYLAYQAMLQEGDKVMILDPAWVTYEPAARMTGADVIRIASSPNSGFQPDLEAIRAAMDDSVKMIVIDSPCNPTGAVFDPSLIRAITELAQSYGAYVLCDEIYEYLIYEGKHYSPAADFDNVITVNGFSKSFAMTGWRLGYLTAPREIMTGMIKIFQHSVSCVPAFAQAGALEALRSETSHQATRNMVETYRKRRQVTLDLIEKSQVFDCPAPTSGAFYLFPAYRSPEPSIAFAQELLEKVHVATVPGGAFGACGEGHLRLCYTATEEDIKTAFQRMESHIKSR